MTLREFVIMQSTLPAGNTVRDHILNPSSGGGVGQVVENLEGTVLLSEELTGIVESTEIEGYLVSDDYTGTISINELTGTIESEDLEGIT